MPILLKSVVLSVSLVVLGWVFTIVMRDESGALEVGRVQAEAQAEDITTGPQAESLNISTEEMIAAVDVDPENATIIKSLAKITEQEGDFLQAANYWGQYAQLSPLDKTAIVSQASNYFAGGRVDLAKQSLLRLTDPSSVDFYVLSAMIGLSDGDVPSALTFVNKALDVEPSSLAAKLTLADIEFSSGNIESAKSVYEEVLRRDDTNLHALVGLVQSLHALGDVEESLSLLEKELPLQNRPYQSSYAAANFFLQNGLIDDAYQIFTNLNARLPGRTELIIPMIEISLSRGEVATAEVLEQEITEITPKNLTAKNYIQALLNYSNGNLDKAEQYLDWSAELYSARQAFQSLLLELYLKTERTELLDKFMKTFANKLSNPYFARYSAEKLLVKSQEFVNIGNITEAKKLLNSYEYLVSKDVSSAFVTAEILLREGRFEDAQNLLKEASQDFAIDDFKFYELEGRVLVGLEEYERSLISFFKMLSAASNNTQRSAAHYHMGIAFYEADRLSESIASMERSLIADPNSTKTLGTIVDLLLKADDAVRAKALINDFNARNNNQQSYVLTLQGNVENYLGETSAAIMSFGEAYQIEPASWDVGIVATDLMRKQGQYIDALSALQEINQQHPGNKIVIFKLALTKQQMGRLQDAKIAYEDLIQRFPDWSILHLNLSEVLIDLEDVDAAIKHAHESVRLTPKLFSSQLNLAKLALHTKSKDLAKSAVLAALEIRPDSEDALTLMAALK